MSSLVDIFINSRKKIIYNLPKLNGMTLGLLVVWGFPLHQTAGNQEIYV